MSDEPKSEITDEVIDSIVAMVEGAEAFAQAMSMSTSQAIRMMLKSAQIMKRIEAKKEGRSLASTLSALGRPQ